MCLYLSITKSLNTYTRSAQTNTDYCTNQVPRLGRPAANPLVATAAFSFSASFFSFAVCLSSLVSFDLFPLGSSLKFSASLLSVFSIASFRLLHLLGVVGVGGASSLSAAPEGDAVADFGFLTRVLFLVSFVTKT